MTVEYLDSGVFDRIEGFRIGGKVYKLAGEELVHYPVLTLDMASSVG